MNSHVSMVMYLQDRDTRGGQGRVEGKKFRVGQDEGKNLGAG